MLHIGEFQLTVLPSYGGMPYDQAEASLELFAKEVMPAARDTPRRRRRVRCAAPLAC